MKTALSPPPCPYSPDSKDLLGFAWVQALCGEHRDQTKPHLRWLEDRGGQCHVEEWRTRLSRDAQVQKRDFISAAQYAWSVGLAKD